MIDDFKVVLTPNMKSSKDIGGMIAVASAARIILLSATFAIHHKDFMYQVLRVDYQN